MKDSLIVISGGMDSVTMLYEYQKQIGHAISFNYGANHNEKEICFAVEHCKALNIPHCIIELEFIKKYFNSSLLQGANAIPEGNYDDENMKSTVVPFRNGIMLSIACGIAESKSLNKIMIANHFGDHSIYPDCTAKFIESMKDAVKNGTYNGIEIFAPYTLISKSDIAKKGHELGIDYTKTWSCYKGEDVHCGACGTCTERKEAFQLANIPDPTIYKK